jgi:hypothetical protein
MVLDDTATSEMRRVSPILAVAEVMLIDSDLLKVESSHEMTQKVRNEPARRPMPAVQAHRPRQPFPNQQAQNVGYPPFHNQHQQHPQQQQQQTRPWNGRPMVHAQQVGQNGNGMPMTNPYGAPPMNQYNNINNGPNMHRPRPPHPHQNHMNNMNGGAQGQQYPIRPGGSLQSGFNNATSGQTGFLPRPAAGGGAGNPYVPPAPFALAPSKGRPPSGPRGSNGPQAGPGGPGGMLPRRPYESNLNSKPNGNSNGGGGSGQSGLPY